MPSVFGSNYRCEHVFSLMKNVNSRTATRLTNEHFERCMQIATADVKPDILKQKQFQITQQWVILAEKIIE
jgi:hypothetical protein